MFHLARESRWRAERLLILAYHGFSLEDEHLWNPSLFMPAEDFEMRLECLRLGGYNVIPLASALEGLYAKTLPKKSVVITIDDGNYDFYAKGYPLLQRYGYPATVYLTTYYCDYNKPLFHHVCSYMLWRRRGACIPTPGLTDSISELDLRTAESRAGAFKKLLAYAEAGKFSAEQKHQFADRLAGALSIDFSELLRKRLLHRMNASEVAEASAAGIDVQLHTHRHRTPDDRILFEKEIDENRARIAEMTGRTATHFCYPSGVYKPDFLPWLTEKGVVSGTTCVPGLAIPSTDPLLLPRMLDGTDVSLLEFEGWACGVGSLATRKARGLHAG